MVLNLDRTFYSVICDLGNCYYTPELDLADMGMKQIVEDVRAGQFERVLAVLEFNPVEGWCNDVTEPVLAQAYPDDETISNFDWSDYRSEGIDGHRAGITLKSAA